MRTTSIGASLTATAAKASQGGALSNPRNDDPTNSAAIQCDLGLLDVAKHLFMERGFDVTSIDEGAEAAQIRKPAAYSQRRDKRSLFVAVLK